MLVRLSMFVNPFMSFALTLFITGNVLLLLSSCGCRLLYSFSPPRWKPMRSIMGEAPYSGSGNPPISGIRTENKLPASFLFSFCLVVITSVLQSLPQKVKLVGDDTGKRTSKSTMLVFLFTLIHLPAPEMAIHKLPAASTCAPSGPPGISEGRA